MCQGATPPNVTLTGPFRHLIGTSLFGAMAHFVYCVTLSVQEIAVKAISYPVDKNSISASAVSSTSLWEKFNIFCRRGSTVILNVSSSISIIKMTKEDKHFMDNYIIWKKLCLSPACL